MVADRHGRHCIGVELNPEYVQIAEKRLLKDAGMFADIVVPRMTPDPVLDDPFHACAFEAFIAEARAVQGWPDPEKTRQRAYRLYEEELARRKR